MDFSSLEWDSGQRLCELATNISMSYFTGNIGSILALTYPLDVQSRSRVCRLRQFGSSVLTIRVPLVVPNRKRATHGYLA